MSQSIAFIGVGNMGCPMAENLMKAGKSVKVFDVSKKMLEIARGKNLEIIENLDDLITADVETVITMLPEGKHSKDVYLGETGIINKETVEYFPKGAVITNVARGDIVDDEALIDALNRRKIYAVGLDVYKNEPNLNPGYLKIPSAFVLPHLGSATKDTRIAMGNLAIDNLDEFFRTGNCINKVN